MERFTSEDIKALREYLDKLEALNRETPPERLTPEEWGEAMDEIQRTGKIPAKYAGRIGENEITSQPEGIKKRAFYDIAQEDYNRRFIELGAEYQKPVEKVLISSLSEPQPENNPRGRKVEDLIKQILEDPVLLKELEKEARRLEKQELPAFGAIPNGEILNWLFRILASKNGRLVQQSSRNRHEEIKVQKQGDSLRFIRINLQTGEVYIIELLNILKHFSKTNKTFSKVFLFVLQKMTAQNFPREPGFLLQELVDLGMYSTQSNALRAFRDFFVQQKDVIMKGTVKKGRKIIKEHGSILFYDYDLDNGYIRLMTNEKFNIEFIANYFTVFPRFAYALSNDAFNLVRYIFFLARQNAAAIKNKGTFTISLEAVRENLGFPAPDEVKNRKYKQYITDPIEAAIEEIEEAVKNAQEAKEYGFTITPVGTDTSNIYKWLEGYLEIGLNGDFAETFIRIATKAEKDRETWNRIKTAELAKLEAKKEAQGQ